MSLSLRNYLRLKGSRVELSHFFTCFNLAWVWQRLHILILKPMAFNKVLIWNSKSILHQDGPMSNGGYYRKCPKMTLTLAKQTQLGLVESMGLGPTSLAIISFQSSNKKELNCLPTLCALSLSLSW